MIDQHDILTWIDSDEGKEVHKNYNSFYYRFLDIVLVWQVTSKP